MDDLEYSGPERRKPQVCAIHAVLWNTLQRDLKRGEDCMHEQTARMDEFSRTLQEHTVALRDMEKALNNGLRSDVARINATIVKYVDCIQEKLTQHDTALDELNSFRWFRDKITKIKDNLFWSTAKATFIILLVLLLLQIADKGVEKITALIGGLL